MIENTNSKGLYGCDLVIWEWFPSQAKRDAKWESYRFGSTCKGHYQEIFGLGSWNLESWCVRAMSSKPPTIWFWLGVCLVVVVVVLLLLFVPRIQIPTWKSRCSWQDRATTPKDASTVCSLQSCGNRKLHGAGGPRAHMVVPHQGPIC